MGLYSGTAQATNLHGQPMIDGCCAIKSSTTGCCFFYEKQIDTRATLCYYANHGASASRRPGHEQRSAQPRILSESHAQIRFPVSGNFLVWAEPPGHSRGRAYRIAHPPTRDYPRAGGPDTDCNTRCNTRCHTDFNTGCNTGPRRTRRDRAWVARSHPNRSSLFYQFAPGPRAHV